MTGHGIVLRHEYALSADGLTETRTGRASAKCACDWTTSGDAAEVRRICQLHLGLSADEDAENAREAEAASAFALDILVQAESLAAEVERQRGRTVTKYMAVRARMLHRRCAGASEAVRQLAGEAASDG